MTEFHSIVTPATDGLEVHCTIQLDPNLKLSQTSRMLRHEYSVVFTVAILLDLLSRSRSFKLTELFLV
jgi:hypothetical protein